jgi:hypothetical protein
VHVYAGRHRQLAVAVDGQAGLLQDQTRLGTAAQRDDFELGPDVVGLEVQPGEQFPAGEVVALLAQDGAPRIGEGRAASPARGYGALANASTLVAGSSPSKPLTIKTP